jgi:hypothetical protein
MGLLDDAIREHLELKRRRGADPAEVAREQHEALETDPDRRHRTELDASGEQGVGGVAADQGVASGAVEHDLAADDHAATEPAGKSSPGAQDAGSLEETAELDMKAVLEDEDRPAIDPAGSPEEGLLEWDANTTLARDESPAVGGNAQARDVDDKSHVLSPPRGQEHLQFEHDRQADAELEK